jgi:hypothetical protein
MPTTIEITALKISVAVAVLIGACAATWFKADAHYSQALSSLEGQLKGASEAQQKAVDKQKADDAAVTKDINEQAQQQIGSMAGTISALLLRKPAGSGAISVCTSSPSAARAPVQPERPAAAASPGPPAIPARPSIEAAIDPGTLTDSLTVGIDAIKAELLWRDYARRTGQTKP